MCVRTRGGQSKKRFKRGFVSSTTLLFAVLLMAVVHGRPAQAADVTCEGGELMPGNHPDDDLHITAYCKVEQAGVYAYHNVHIYATWDDNGNPTSKGTLEFLNPPGNESGIHFWAQSILVENEGSLIAGTTDNPIGKNFPVGKKGGVVTIHLYGPAKATKPFDENDNDGGVGIICQTEMDPPPMPPQEPTPTQVGPCGIPWKKWQDNGTTKFDDLPGGVTDYFYQYGPLPYDDGIDVMTGRQGFFGYKVLAVSYGGTLQLFGAKGTLAPDDLATEEGRQDSGKSWARLNQTLQPPHDMQPGDTVLVLDRVVDWEKEDRIMVTTTDYVPGHTEERTIQSVAVAGEGENQHSVVTITEPVDFIHNGKTYKLRGEESKNVPMGVGPDYDEVDTRAAVGLLTRSIRIVSAGDPFPPDDVGQTCDYDCFPSETKPGTTPCTIYCFGGHTIVRQGVKKFQVRGAEYYQLGQGGRIGHYSVHFHLTRKTPKDPDVPGGTFVKDSSMHDSMTRWIVVHGAHNLILARNVGYKSMGHGYYLEDGTEIDNELYSNLGALARAAVQDHDGQPQKQNPRKVPGILAWGDSTSAMARNGFPNASDYLYPTVFWFTNSWNHFEGNMAVGATACGAAYWPVVTAISGASVGKTWESYAGIRPVEAGSLARGLSAPLKKFKKNYASTAQWSFSATGGNAPCQGIGRGDGTAILQPVPNPLIPAPKEIPPPPSPNPLPPDLFVNENYYPRSVGAFPNATRCDLDDCNNVPPCSAGNPGQCMVTVLDTYTSSFHWAEGNFSAIWLRHAFFVFLNSALTDVQGGGLSFVTGGDYTQSSVKPGSIMLSTHSVFVGHTQPNNPFASDAGPFRPEGLQCAVPAPGAFTPQYCLSKNEALSMPRGTAFMIFQRFFNIYDGPSYEDSNAYLDITRTPIMDCGPAPSGMFCGGVGIPCTTNADCTTQPLDQRICSLAIQHDCNNSEFMYGPVVGIRYNPNAPEKEKCYLPNAAIAWKQQNGFYYPPAFNSTNLYLDDVDIRHYVVEPLFLEETDKEQPFKTDVAATRANYCTFQRNSFDNFTAIDRQTVLNDDDGSLTGLFVEAPRCEFQKQICQNDDQCPRVCSNDHSIQCADNSACTGDGQCVAQRCMDEKIATISVNEDSFFNAPVETFQCLSDRLAGAEGTAKTSPYEYVTTVVYPGCAITNSCASDWSVECGNSSCYGVPLYRQYQTGSEKDNPNPEDRKIRMMGPAVYGRINLTANNGLYYIDTTPGADKQDKFPLKNIFKADQTYYVFLLFAKPSTEQTYQLYVADGKGKFDPETEVKAVSANLSTLQVDFKEMDWPSEWKREYGTDGPGILTVTMNFRDFAENFQKAREHNCQPSSFCEFKQSSCQCSDQLMEDNPQLYQECVNKDICFWSGKEVDCPLVNIAEEGKPEVFEPRCLGFAVTLAQSFQTDPEAPPDLPQPDRMNYPRPAAKCFDVDEPTREKWDVQFVEASEPVAGDCFQTPVGMNNFCANNFPNALGGFANAVGDGTPGDAIASLSSDVNLLVSQGEFAQRHAKGLLKKLSKAMKKLEKGKSACRQLAKFVKKVKRRVKKGKLGPEEGEALVGDADAIREDLGCVL